MQLLQAYQLFLVFAGTPVTVGVTMYILSISSVSEVMMVHAYIRSLPVCLSVYLSLAVEQLCMAENQALEIHILEMDL